MSDRAAAIATFLALNGWADAERQRVAGDASARRFERLRRARDNGNPPSVILMDSAADDTLAAFVRVARLLSRLDISVPELLAQDVDLELLLLEDFGDETFDKHGITVVCDSKSLLYLNGTTIDFKDEIMGRGFMFNNPNATSSCGCGSSFSA